VEIDRQIEPGRAQTSDERDVRGHARGTSATWRHDHLVEVKVRGHDRRRSRFDDVRNVRLWKTGTNRAQGGSGEDDVANLPQPDEENS
jgi:hypothetical protein